MKSTAAITNIDLFKSKTCIKIATFTFIIITFFFLGKHYVDGDTRHLLFFSSSGNSALPHSAVSISPNFNKTYNLSNLIPSTESLAPLTGVVGPPPPPPDSELNRTVYGVVDSEGRMSDDFDVGDFDPGVVESWGNDTGSGEGEGEHGGEGGPVSFKKRYELCPDSMREYIPCLDNVEAIKRLSSTERGERFERHCPQVGKGLDCLVPAPNGYRSPIPWPRSRDEVAVFSCF